MCNNVSTINKRGPKNCLYVQQAKFVDCSSILSPQKQRNSEIEGRLHRIGLLTVPALKIGLFCLILAPEGFATQ